MVVTNREKKIEMIESDTPPIEPDTPPNEPDNSPKIWFSKVEATRESSGTGKHGYLNAYISYRGLPNEPQYIDIETSLGTIALAKPRVATNGSDGVTFKIVIIIGIAYTNKTPITLTASTPGVSDAIYVWPP